MASEPKLELDAAEIESCILGIEVENVAEIQFPNRHFEQALKLPGLLAQLKKELLGLAPETVPHHGPHVAFVGFSSCRLGCQ